MEVAGDIVHADPWRESLERSRARRRAPQARSSARAGLEPPRDARARELPGYWRLCARALARHWLTILVASAGVLSLVLLSLPRSNVPTGTSIRGSLLVRARVSSRAAEAQAVNSGAAARDPAGAATSPAPACQPDDRSSGYFDPLAAAIVTPKRVDQGVDYAGSGALTAIGDAIIAYIATSDTGWPGAFIEYRLRSGPETGCYVYYAEGVRPARGLYVGKLVEGGQAVATIDPANPAGIEIGWGAGDGTKSYAAQKGQWSAKAEEDNTPTSAGLSFSALIASLGGPPGRIEG